MNNDDLQQHRVGRALAEASKHVELEPGDVDAVASRGRQRSNRVRRSSAVALAMFCGGGTLVAIQQLSGGTSAVQTDPSSVTAPSTPDVSWVGGSSPEPAEPSAVTTAPPDVAEPTVEPARAVEARAIEPTMIWRVVEPDTTEAVGWVESYGDSMVSHVPGVFLSTSPGRSQEWVPTIWRTEDGISWAPLEGVDLPFGTAQQLRTVGSSMYLLATAPGVAATEPNPLFYGRSSDGGATWESIELPIDAHRGRDLPFVVGGSAYGVVTETDDGVVIAVSSGLQLDFDAAFRAAGISESHVRDVSSSGITVVADSTCQRHVIPSTVAVDSADVATTVPGSDDAECETRVIPWSDAGVPAEAVDAALGMGPVRIFTLVDGELTELETPPNVNWFSVAPGGRLVVSHNDQETYEFIDGAFVQVNHDERFGASHNSQLIGANEHRSFSRTWSEMTAWAMEFHAEQYLVTDLVTGEQILADWTLLYGDGRVGFEHAAGVTNAGFVRVGPSFPDPVAEQGGVSVDVDGYTFRRESVRTPVVVTGPDGFVLDGARVVFTDEGRLVLLDGSDEEILELRDELVGPVLWGPGVDNDAAAWTIAVSDDGVNVSVESVADLLGVTDAEIAGIARLSTDGVSTLVAVTLEERGADGVPRQLVLVGTPRG